MTYALLILIALAFGLPLRFLADRRGANPPLWFGLGVVLGPIAVPLLLLVPRSEPSFGDRPVFQEDIHG